MKNLPKKGIFNSRLYVYTISNQGSRAKRGILIAFGELFLKSRGVKKLFKEKLIRNIRFFLRKENIDFKIHPSYERIFVETIQEKETAKVIKRIFGIAWFAESFYFPQTTLKNFSDFISKNYPDRIEKGKTFAIRLKLEKGILRKNRGEVIDKIAEQINRKVNLTKPKEEIFVEVRKTAPPSLKIRRAKWFLYFKKIKGAGGFPIGSSGKVLSLISGGIDSPIAAYLIAKRGAENVWVHFHSFPLVSNTSIEKVKELAKVFLRYQPHLRIYFIPFQKAQIEVKTKTPAKYRILLYRRLMFKMAERIAKRENCQSLVTGESLGQVSSQTLPNIKIVEGVVKIPVLRPLIGMDKEEIIKVAKKIGTFPISIKPQEDCCTLFVPKHQTAQGRLEIIKELEKKLDINKIIREIIKRVRIEKY